MAENSVQEQQFKAEVRKVLRILTNSLYTNREIFLRELISNASDALDKLRFRESRGEAPRVSLPLEIRISLDENARTLTIADSGLGMTAEELAENLGTIARSGSEAFLAELDEQAAADGGSRDASNIIGRFGVGFYSVFMVADKVEVTSVPAYGDDAQAHVWTSDGLGTYTVAPCEAGDLERGTRIVVHLKEDAREFAEKFRVESVIRSHSAFVPFPIFVGEDRVNTQPALWREPKSAVTREQYDAFYTHLTYDSKAPLEVLHIAVDAPVQFNALLYVPDSTQDIFGMDRDYWGLDLYSRRVLIQHRNKELLPEYLAFIKGVVDTEDLPLNISRETLQENVVLRKIRQTIVKQTLSHLEKLAASDAEKYAAFWKLHSRIFKLGYQDFPNRERISALLRFNTSFHEDAAGLSSLDDYMSRAPEGQKTIWYVTAPNREAARLSPHLERFRKKGIEVLFLYEPVDEFVMEGLHSYKDWEFKAAENAADDALDAFADKADAEKPAAAPLSDDDSASFDGLLTRMKEILGERVTEVRVSHRLAQSPAVLVSPDGSMTSSMEKFLRVMQKDDSLPVKVLEVNRDHPLLRSLLRMFKADAQDQTLASMVECLFDACLLQDGYLRDPQALAARSNALLEKAAAWYGEVKQL